MKRLILISVFIALAYSAPEESEESERSSRQFGAYSFSYTGDNLAKSEVRETDGTIRGGYTFVDEFGRPHQIQYIAGANRGFEIISHKVQENGQYVEVPSGDTPEVVAARESHLRYQAQVKASLPALDENQPQPQQFHIQRFESHQPQQQRFQPQHPHQIFQQEQTIAHESPVYLRRIPAPTVPIIEVVHPHHFVINHVPSPVKQLPVVPIVEVQPPQRIANAFPQVQTHVPSVQVFESEVRDFIVPEDYQHFATVNVQTIPPVPAFQAFPQPQPVHVEHSHSFPQAHDIQLVDGFTPEVAAARDQHLATFAQIKASLPDTDE